MFVLNIKISHAHFKKLFTLSKFEKLLDFLKQYNYLQIYIHLYG